MPRLRLICQKRAVFSNYIKQMIEAWWNNQTKVSPKKKDLVRHRIRWNLWLKPHPTHYLYVSGSWQCVRTSVNLSEFLGSRLAISILYCRHSQSISVKKSCGDEKGCVCL